MQSELSEATTSRPEHAGGLGAPVGPARPGESASRAEHRAVDMRRPDVAEFLGAFVIGAVIGATAMMLMRPEPKHGMARLRKDLAPYGKRVREKTRDARRSLAEGADSASAAAEALGQAGRILVHDLREEVAEIVRDARSDLTVAVNEQVGQALKRLRRGSYRMGRR